MASINNTVITKDMITAAQKSEKKTGVPTSITLAQIIQESTSGGKLSGLAKNANNLFGEKGTGTAGSVIMATTEYKNGKPYRTNAAFKKFNSYQESIDSHARLLNNRRYTRYTKNATTIEDYAKGIQKGGYATDPSYSKNLINLINNYNLNQYNVTQKYAGLVQTQAPVKSSEKKKKKKTKKKKH